MKNKHGQVHENPNILHDYNDGMAGINRSDQMLSYYPGLQKSVRWYKKIGFHYAEIFVFNAYWLNTKIGKSKLSLLHFRLAMVKYLLGDMISQSLQSSLSSPPTSTTWSSFHKKTVTRKSILVTNAGIVAWVVKQQIIVHKGFFVMLVLKVQHYVLNHVSSCTKKLSKIKFTRPWLLQNTDLCIMYVIMINMRKDLTVTNIDLCITYIITFQLGKYI